MLALELEIWCFTGGWSLALGFFPSADSNKISEEHQHQKEGRLGHNTYLTV
jgi:hypothetical protein